MLQSLEHRSGYATDLGTKSEGFCKVGSAGQAATGNHGRYGTDNLAETVDGRPPHVPERLRSVGIIAAQDFDASPRCSSGTGNVDHVYANTGQLPGDTSTDAGANFLDHDGHRTVLHGRGDGIEDSSVLRFALRLH